MGRGPGWGGAGLGAGVGRQDEAGFAPDLSCVQCAKQYQLVFIPKQSEAIRSNICHFSPWDKEVS